MVKPPKPLHRRLCHPPLRRNAGRENYSPSRPWGKVPVVLSTTLRAFVAFFCLAVLSDVLAQIAPTITAPPRSQTNWAGNNVILAAAVTGTEPFSYQWRFNETPMAGQTNFLLFLPMPTTNDTGSYSLVVTNSWGAVTSSPAALLIKPVFGSGTVVAWGWDVGETNVPAGLSGVTAIACGCDFSVALKNDGTVVGWNMYQPNVPYGLSGVLAIACGCNFMVALKNDGTVVTDQANILAGLSGVVAIAAGDGHIVAIRHDGTVVAWGAYDADHTTVPPGLGGIVAIACGSSHTVALKSDGTVVAWGSNSHGQTNIPAGLSGVTAIAAGGYCTVAIKRDDTVVEWGSYSDGYETIGLGQWGVPDRLGEVMGVACGYRNTVACKSDGSVAEWGWIPSVGQCNVPVGLSGVTAVAVARNHTVAITTIAGLPIRIHVNGVFVPNGSVVRENQAAIALYTTYLNSTIYYSKDGSAPYIGGPLTYTGAFTVTTNTTIRALAVNLNDFSTAASEPITINIIPSVPIYTLTLTTAGGGTMAKTPSASSYLSNSVVTITARPHPGWTFVSWAGDATGTSTTNIVTMDRAKSVQANFGTTVNTTTPGDGSIETSPASGPYPYGSIVKCTAVPSNGYSFALWGGAAGGNGNLNPLNYTITTANPTVSGWFLPAPTHQTITFGPLPSTTLGDPPFALTATASSGLPVTYDIVSGPATVTGNMLTITGGGSVVVRALQSGNPDYSAAPSVDQSFSVYLTLTRAVVGNGTLTRDPDLAQYTNGAVVLLTAMSGFESIFTGWSGSASGTNNPLSVVMDTNKSITANFYSTNLPPSQPVFSLSAATYSVFENDGAVSITVLKSANSLAGAVNYSTANGSAIAWSGHLGDFLPMSGTLKFTASETSKTVVIQIVDDPIYEGNEQFAFCLSLVDAGNTSLQYPASAVVTIFENDPPTSTNSFLGVGFPDSVPAHDGQLQVSLEPPNNGGQWRLAWETAWRNSGDTMGGLPSGNYQIISKPVGGFFPPGNTITPVTAGTFNSVTNYYLSSGGASCGSWSVTIEPASVANHPVVASRGQWRVQGEPDWHVSGFVLTNLAAGSHIAEFKTIPGYDTPAARQVMVGANQVNLIAATYLVASAVNGTPPSVLQFSTVTQPALFPPPYPWCGQLLSDVGYGSGCVVKKRVVLSAGHVVFDDANLSFVSGVNWFFQRHQGIYEPPPQVPRGWYVFGGYAAARTNDNSPGVSSPTSQNLDLAALYFLEDAGRGGFSGYLVSNPAGVEWLQASAQKALIGYPVEIVPENNRGRMHATTPQNIAFSSAGDRLFATSEIIGYPGMSGGPLCVQATNSVYYPAGVFLGGSGQTIVRAIDGAAADLINRAEITSYTGQNSTGGGVITITPSQNISVNNPGYLQVHLAPPSALRAGAGWRLQGTADYSSQSNFTEQINSTNAMAAEFKPLPGWNLPGNQSVTVVRGQLTLYTAFYSVTNPVLGNNRAGGISKIGMTGTTGTVYRLEKASALTNATWQVVNTNTILTNGFNPVLTNPPPGFYRLEWLGNF